MRFLHLPLTFLCLCLAFNSCCTQPTPVETIQSPTGLAIPISLVRNHLPHAPAHSLHTHLFEHTPDGYLVSHSSRLSVSVLAPDVQILPLSSARVRINGRIHNPPRGPTLRRGTSHTFVYDYASGVLLAAWGPHMNLRPLHIDHHPNVMVNVISEDERRKMAHLLSSTHHRDDNSLDTHVHQQTNGRLDEYRPGYRRERHIFFDPAFAFDASFCDLYAGSGLNASQVVHSVAVEAHRMSLIPIVSLRVGDIVGFCHAKSTGFVGAEDARTTELPFDAFASPRKRLLECPRSSKTCSRPALRLKYFRHAWRRYMSDSLSDATYLLTADDATFPGDVVGAAWVASACSEFAYGWVIGNHPVVLAHEMGHSLGAPHTSSEQPGLMSPYLNISQPTIYNPVSLRAIEAFLYRIRGQRCMVSRHVGRFSGRRRRFSGFTMLLREPGVEGTDVALAPMLRAIGQVDVAMMFVKRWANGAIRSSLRMTTLYRAPVEENPNYPFSYSTPFKNVFIRGSAKCNASAGGGVGMASLRESPDGMKHNDVAAVFKLANSPKAYYVVGFDLDAQEGLHGGWSAKRFIPTPFGDDVRAMGAAMGDLRGNGLIDLIVTFIVFENGVLQPKFIIGYNMNSNGVVMGRWSELIDLPWNSTADIGDISVSMFVPTPPENVTDAPLPATRLLFTHTERIEEENSWDYRVTLAEHAMDDWSLLSPSKINWRSYTPDIQRRRSKLLRKLTGGVAVTRLLSPDPTSVIFQQRTFPRSGSQWIEIGDGILTRERPAPREKAVEPTAQLALSVGETITPALTCSKCYSGNDIKACEASLRSCFLHRSPSYLGTVYSVRQAHQSLSASSRSVALRPSSPSLFCYGFHALYVSPMDVGGECRWDATRTDIVAEGLRQALFEEIREEVSVTKLYAGVNTTELRFESNVTVDSEPIPDNLRFIAHGPFNTPARLPVSVTVEIVPQLRRRKLRQFVVKRAINRLRRKREDVSSVYAEDNIVKTVVRKRGKKAFVVILFFNLRFKEQFLRDASSA